jgi:hypothetical protein
VLGDVIRPNFLMIFYSSPLEDVMFGRDPNFSLPCICICSDGFCSAKTPHLCFCLSRDFLDIST